MGKIRVPFSGVLIVRKQLFIKLIASDLRILCAQILVAASLDTKELDFGTTYSGYYPTTLTAQASLTNMGSNPLKVTGFSSDNPEFGGTTCPSDFV